MLSDASSHKGIRSDHAAAFDLRAFHDSCLDPDPYMVANHGFPGIVCGFSFRIENLMMIRVGKIAHSGKETLLADRHLISADDYRAALNGTGANLKGSIPMHLDGAVIHHINGARNRHGSPFSQSQVALRPGVGVFIGVQIQIRMKNDLCTFAELDAGIPSGKQVFPFISPNTRTQKIIVNEFK